MYEWENGELLNEKTTKLKLCYAQCIFIGNSIYGRCRNGYCDRVRGRHNYEI